MIVLIRLWSHLVLEYKNNLSQWAQHHLGQYWESILVDNGRIFQIWYVNVFKTLNCENWTDDPSIRKVMLLSLSFGSIFLLSLSLLTILPFMKVDKKTILSSHLEKFATMVAYWGLNSLRAVDEISLKKENSQIFIMLGLNQCHSDYKTTINQWATKHLF